MSAQGSLTEKRGESLCVNVCDLPSRVQGAKCASRTQQKILQSLFWVLFSRVKQPGWLEMPFVSLFLVSLSNVKLYKFLLHKFCYLQKKDKLLCLKLVVNFRCKRDNATTLICRLNVIRQPHKLTFLQASERLPTFLLELVSL